MHLSIGVSDERRTAQVEFDVASESASKGNGDGERFAIAQSPRHAAQGGASTAEVRWRESLDPKLGGVGTRERVELVGVASCNKNASIGKQVGGRVIQSRNG